MDNYSNETSNDVLATRTNAFADESQNVVSLSTEETIRRYDTTFREAGAACPTKFMDWSGAKFTDDAVMKSVPADPRVERHAEDAFARENEDTRRNGNEARTSREFVAHLEIERDGGRSRETGNFKMKAEEPSPVMFLVSILQESAVLVKNSKEDSFDEKIVDLGMDASKEKCTAVDREENRNPSSVADTWLEECSSSKKTNDAQRDNSFGIVSKIRANTTGGGLATQSRRDETVKDVGLFPENSSTRNSGATESTIYPTRSHTTSYGKEEAELNTIIRRMIIMELNKHRKREQTMLKRAHSDTESVLARKRYNDGRSLHCPVDVRNCSRTGLFSGVGQTFFRDLLELEESLRKRVDSQASRRSAAVEIDETTTKRDYLAKQAGNRSTRDRERESIDPTATSTCRNVDSDIRLERKVNASCLRDAEAERSIAPRTVLTTDRQIQADKSTQTEHVYLIRAVRSCPLRKRRLPAHLQLHRLASGRDAVCSRTVYPSPDLSTFVFRKASDNLIYEKGKASRSPSYIPNPERHRWKYITPRKTE